MGAIFEPFVWMLSVIVNIYFAVVLAEVVIHWLIHFKIVDTKNAYIAKIVEILTRLTAPVYKKIAEKVPPFSGIDFSPFVLLLALLFIGRILYRLDVMLMM